MRVFAVGRTPKAIGRGAKRGRERQRGHAGRREGENGVKGVLSVKSNEQ